jgi:hypothetical protein
MLRATLNICAHCLCYTCCHTAGVVELLPSLLAWDPTRYGLPAFKDLVASVIPLDNAFYIKGKVVKGFGRGSKVRPSCGSFDRSYTVWTQRSGMHCYS